MKEIAIISDIHFNKYALNVFLNYIEKQKINIILNLGDFVQIGPNPYEVSNIILNDKRFINILEIMKQVYLILIMKLKLKK